MRPLFLFLCLAASNSLFSQTNIQQSLSINSSGAAPDASAQLDVSATDKGVLVPRMTTAQRLAIASPATGLLVFDTTTGGFLFFNGTAWQAITGPSGPAGGDLSGTYPNPDIAAGAVSTTELAAGSVTAAKVSSGAALNGQVLAANGAGGANWSTPAGGGGIPNSIQDNDTDTKIQMEESPDEDIIRFDLDGTEKMVLLKNA
ncbi:MAG: hypothetical protein AAB316_12605, partial [Bacteroidota bacterium]